MSLKNRVLCNVVNPVAPCGTVYHRRSAQELFISVFLILVASLNADEQTPGRRVFATYSARWNAVEFHSMGAPGL
jgi:hypothetical protein